MTNTRLALYLPLILLFFLSTFTTSVSAGGKDVVIFGNSRMEGDFKKLTRGKLYFKTEATDTITIDWANVTSLQTEQRLRLERQDGTITIGTIQPDEKPSYLLVNDGTEERLPLHDVVAILPLDDSFWDQLDISTSLGYSFTKSTEAEQMNFSIDVGYDTPDRSRLFSAYSDQSSADGTTSDERKGASYETIKFREASPVFTGWQFQYEDSDALNLDYRLLAGAIAGREFYFNANQRVRPFGGLGITRERPTGESEKTNAELILGTLVDWYKFSSPEVDLSSSFIMYPSLTESGRVRASVDITLTWEIVEDLFWQLTFYDDYDNETADESGTGTTSLSDYGITTGLGWSW